MKQTSRGKLPRAILAGFLFLLCAFVFASFFESKTYLPRDVINRTQEPGSNENATENKIEKRDCSGTAYIDLETGFSINCPENLKVYIYRDSYNPNLKKQEKIVFLCETEISTDAMNGYYRCPSGGIMVWANGEGWGGGGGVTETIQIGASKYTYSSHQNGFGQLYLGDVNSKLNRNRYLIEGSFSSTFKKMDATELLKSFKMN